MFKNSFLLVFRFHHNGNPTDERYNSLRNSLTKFVEEHDGKEDESTSTCLFYTTNDPILLAEELIGQLYTETIPYHEDDKIVIFHPEDGHLFEDILQVAYISNDNGTPTLTRSSFLEYINALEPTTKVFRTPVEELMDDINAQSLR